MNWREFAIIHKLPEGTVYTHNKRGYCAWPRRTNRNNHKNNIAYGSWCAMWVRCTNPQHDKYPLYGGRGISVDPRWRSFDTFLQEVGPRPSGLHSLDRIDPDGNYVRGNVRWATQRQQCLNQRKHKNVDKYYGISKHGRKYQIQRLSTVHRFNTMEEAVEFKNKVDNAI